MSGPKSIRLTPQLEERLEAIAKAKGVTISAAIRFALERGVAAIEKDAAPTTSAPEAPRRRVLSKGVG
jgi:predicted DNA-binding protein